MKHCRVTDCEYSQLNQLKCAAGIRHAFMTECLTSLLLKIHKVKETNVADMGKGSQTKNFLSYVQAGFDTGQVHLIEKQAIFLSSHIFHSTSLNLILVPSPHVLPFTVNHNFNIHTVFTQGTTLNKQHTSQQHGADSDQLSSRVVLIQGGYS